MASHMASIGLPGLLYYATVKSPGTTSLNYRRQLHAISKATGKERKKSTSSYPAQHFISNHTLWNLLFSTYSPDNSDV